jgi:flagellar hook-length control protein FliK
VTSDIVSDASGASPAPRPAGGPEATSGPGSAAGAPPVVQQLAAGIGRLRRDGRQEVSLRLDPPHLGAVRIEARLDGSQLTLQIHAAVPATRDLLEQELPRLREALAQQGIVPGEVTIGLGLDGSSRRSPGDAFAPPPPAPAPAAPVRAGAAAPARWRDAGHDGFEFWV